MAIENRIGKVKSTKKALVKDFDKDKIAAAIIRAANDVGGLAANISPDSVYARFVGDSEQDLAQTLTEDVILCLNMQRKYRFPHNPPTLEEIHDLVIDVLKDRGFVSVSSSYSIYREGQRAARRGWIAKEHFCGNGFPNASINKRRKWCEKRGITTTDDLNQQIEHGKFGELVAEDSKRYEKELKRAVNRFEQEQDKRNLRVMIIAGPSSSGKTTTSQKLCGYLNDKGFRFKLLAVDNYFFSTTEYPRDWFGDMDYELPESIDLYRFNQDLERLMKNKKIYPPEYDFKTGQRVQSKKPFQLAKDEILLLDCLHGLYPPTTTSIDDSLKFKVYIENHPVIQTSEKRGLRFTDVRLLRRMCRDVRERGYSVQYTLTHWATVRRGEFKGIIPFQRTADVMVNGSLIYDLPALKYYLLNYCDSPFDDDVLESYRQNGRIDAYTRGKRIKKLFAEVRVPSAEEIKTIPGDNLIREFIGTDT